jgi:hypothetical protein
LLIVGDPKMGEVDAPQMEEVKDFRALYKLD